VNSSRFPSRHYLAFAVFTCLVAQAIHANAAGQEMVYWADFNTGNIRRANLDGSNPQTVVTSPAGPTGIAVDQLHSRIYWLTLNAIYSANFDGSNVQTVLPLSVSLGDRGGRAMTIDPIGQKMYWAVDPSDAARQGIRRANLDGSNVENVYTPPYSPGGTVGVVEGVAVDPAHGKLYFTQINFKNIIQSNLDGSSATVFVSDPLVTSSLFGIGVDPSAAMVFWLPAQAL